MFRESIMIKSPSDSYAIQRQFKDVNALLMNVVDSLSRSGNPIVSTAIQDITRVSQSLLTAGTECRRSDEVEAESASGADERWAGDQLLPGTEDGCSRR